MCGVTRFPLIPLPIKEAITIDISSVVRAEVSINSTSYKRSDVILDIFQQAKLMFPLIPLPIKEAIGVVPNSVYVTTEVFAGFH